MHFGIKQLKMSLTVLHHDEVKVDDKVKLNQQSLRKSGTQLNVPDFLNAGPQHREFLSEIRRTKQVGVRGPNIENFSVKFNRQSKLGFGAPT